MDSTHYGRQCFRKIQMTESEAHDSAKRMHKKHKKRFNVYLCPYCKAFHVGGDRSAQAAVRRFERAQ